MPLPMEFKIVIFQRAILLSGAHEAGDQGLITGIRVILNARVFFFFFFCLNSFENLSLIVRSTLAFLHLKTAPSTHTPLY
jgi:hypothetical protein